MQEKNKYRWNAQPATPDKLHFHWKENFFRIILPFRCFLADIWKQRYQSYSVFLNSGCTLESSRRALTPASARSQLWDTYSRFSEAGTPAVISFRSSPNDSNLQLHFRNCANYPCVNRKIEQQGVFVWELCRLESSKSPPAFLKRRLSVFLTLWVGKMVADIFNMPLKNVLFDFFFMWSLLTEATLENSCVVEV